LSQYGIFFDQSNIIVRKRWSSGDRLSSVSDVDEPKFRGF